VLIRADYSQIELRVAAAVSGDAAMIAAFQRQEDLHDQTARRFTGFCPPTRAQREMAKVINFGVLYGMGAKALAGYARSAFGVEISVADAERLRRTVLDAHPGLAAWQRATLEDRAEETRTLIGRRRLYRPDDSPAARVSSIIQGTVADALKIALGLMWLRRHECPGARPIMAIHDEIVVEAPARIGIEAAAWVNLCMHEAMRCMLGVVPVAVSVTLGSAWGV
jgi:DNA polymerase-1